MTRSLRDALHDAADDAGIGFRLTPDETLELARRRTRYKRWARPLLAAGVVTVIAGGALSLPRIFYPAPTAVPTATPRVVEPAVPPTSTPKLVRPVGSAVFPDGNLTTAQVLARCRPVAERAFGKGASYELGQGVPRAGYQPGYTVALRHAKKRDTGCIIPFERPPGKVSGPLPALSDDWAVKQACGTLAGHDLTGWRTVAKAAGNGGLTAVFASSNGWDATCVLEPPTWVRVEWRAKAGPYVRGEVSVHATSRGSAPRWPGSVTPVDIVKGTPEHEAGTMWLKADTLVSSSGVVTAADTLTLTFNNGHKVVVPVVEGRYAYVVRTQAAAGPDAVDVVVRDAKGKVLLP